MLGYFVWDPPKEAFYLPWIDHPIAWYGIIFGLGFLIGLFLFQYLLYVWLMKWGCIGEGDVRWENKNKQQTFISCNKKETLEILNKELIRYGRLGLQKNYPDLIYQLKFRVKEISEGLLFYVIIGTILGARIGHIAFYENITPYLLAPWKILMVWEGGLASHGGIVGVLLALAFFYKKYRPYLGGLLFIQLLDLLVVPSAFISTCIRIGNFINQEILGIVTTKPWAVIFLHPIDGSNPAVRHPVQLYEALFYFCTFIVLLIIFLRTKGKYKPASLVGWFFIATFTFRFFIEFLKEKQSILISDSTWLNMGQILSIPLVLLGIVLLYLGKKRAF